MFNKNKSATAKSNIKLTHCLNKYVYISQLNQMPHHSLYTTSHNSVSSNRLRAKTENCLVINCEAKYNVHICMEDTVEMSQTLAIEFYYIILL